MSANRGQRFQSMASVDGTSEPGAAGSDADPEVSFEPRPLPGDPKVRAEILAGIERGLAEARAGQGIDLDAVLAELDAKLAARGL